MPLPAEPPLTGCVTQRLSLPLRACFLLFSGSHTTQDAERAEWLTVCEEACNAVCQQEPPALFPGPGWPSPSPSPSVQAQRWSEPWVSHLKPLTDP